MKVVYIKPNEIKEKKPTARQLFHQEAVATLARRKALDKIKAKKLFEPEMEEIRQLELKLKQLEDD